jgi:hypothetical protein
LRVTVLPAPNEHFKEKDLLKRQERINRMLKLMQLRLLPSFKVRFGKPMIAQISLRVHVKKAEQEYHSQAYAIRVNGDATELLVADKNKKLLWLDTEHIEVVEEALMPV